MSGFFQEKAKKKFCHSILFVHTVSIIYHSVQTLIRRDGGDMRVTDTGGQSEH